MPGDILRDRLDATTAWLAGKPDTDWTLQTISTTSEQNLRNHLRFLEKSIEINKVFVYRHRPNTDQKAGESRAEGAVYSVLFGSYADRVAAERARADLPAQLKSNKPLPVMIQHIRTQLRDG